MLVLAKTPVPGRVKTRLCPPCTPEQAAAVAAAALADTLDAVTARDRRPGPGRRRRLPRAARLGAVGAARRPLGDRLANAYADTRIAGRPAC